MRDEHRLEDGVRSGRGAGQDDGAGTEVVFEGEVAGAVVVFEVQGVRGGEKFVEGRVAVGGRDAGGMQVRGEAGVWDVVGGGGV